MANSTVLLANRPTGFLSQLAKSQEVLGDIWGLRGFNLGAIFFGLLKRMKLSFGPSNLGFADCNSDPLNETVGW